MKTQVYELLEKFDKMDLPRKNGIITVDGDKVKFDSVDDLREYLVRYKINGVPVFAKSKHLNSGTETNNIYACTEILLGQVYNELGVNSALAYSFLDRKSDPKNPIIFTQDLKSLKGLDVYEFIAPDEIYRMVTKEWSKDFFCYEDIWEFLKDKKYLVEDTKIMSPEAFDQLINTIILDRGFVQTDRHMGNVILYSDSIESQKVDGVIAFDHEDIMINSMFLNEGKAKDLAQRIYNDPNMSLTLKNKLYISSQKSSLLDINEKIQNGTFGESQKALITRIKEYNLDKKLATFEEDNNIHMSDRHKDLFKYTFENVQETLQR